jgi:TonB family protein
MRLAVLVAFLLAFSAAQSYPGERESSFSDLRTQPPSATRKVEPEYTKEARTAGIEGTVVLYLEIGTDGRARRIRVIRGLGFGLDRKAIEALRQWRFDPGMKNGKLVTTPATIEIDFRLGAGPKPVRT